MFGNFSLPLFLEKINIDDKILRYAQNDKQAWKKIHYAIATLRMTDRQECLSLRINGNLYMKTPQSFLTK